MDLRIVVANAIVTMICIPGIMSGINRNSIQKYLSLYYWCLLCIRFGNRFC